MLEVIALMTRACRCCSGIRSDVWPLKRRFEICKGQEKSLGGAKKIGLGRVSEESCRMLSNSNSWTHALASTM